MRTAPLRERSSKVRAFFFSAVAALPALAIAQSPTTAPDMAVQALNAAFGRDNGIFLCLDRGYTANELRSRLEPFIRDIDTTKEESFRPLVAAAYDAFPCPFSPLRSEFERANGSDIVGRWTFAESSISLRHGPRSPAWSRGAGMPPIKCEAVVIQSTGAYRVAQVMGSATCPDSDPDLIAKLEANQQVASWRMAAEGRLRIDRSDVAGQFEEWDVFAVKRAFEIGRFKFVPGELLAYQRRDPKNEMHAATMFRHLQRLGPARSASGEEPSKSDAVQTLAATPAQL